MKVVVQQAATSKKQLQKHFFKVLLTRVIFAIESSKGAEIRTATFVAENIRKRVFFEVLRVKLKQIFAENVSKVWRIKQLSQTMSELFTFESDSNTLKKIIVQISLLSLRVNKS